MRLWRRLMGFLRDEVTSIRNQIAHPLPITILVGAALIVAAAYVYKDVRGWTGSFHWDVVASVVGFWLAVAWTLASAKSIADGAPGPQPTDTGSTPPGTWTTVRVFTMPPWVIVAAGIAVGYAVYRG